MPTWSSTIQGDLGEVLLNNSAWSDVDRLGVEVSCGEKFGLRIDEERTVAQQTVYTEAGKGVGPINRFARLHLQP